MGKCSKKSEESYAQYRERVLNSISPSFCGAKWFNSTIWLGSGMTASCHHPLAHRIPMAEVLKNHKAIHNTKYKKEIRKQMLEGIRPKECEYCWKIEDLGGENISDRVHKSLIYSEEELLAAKENFNWENDVDLLTLEISFDSICNLACSYCGPSFSSKWQNDIEGHGPYVNLISDGAQAYQNSAKSSMLFGKNNENNPYVDAFWKWWDSGLKFSLRELRITGGEPLMSPHFWKLMEWWKNNDQCGVDLAVNSNLCTREELIKSLIRSTHAVKDFHLYTSCESVGKKAEYIRDGLEWDTWLSNLKSFIEEAQFKSVNCMMTINALCLFSMTEFLDEMIKLKLQYKEKAPVCSLNILRFPSFMSVSTLPFAVRQERAGHIEKWLSENQKYFLEWEIDGIKRLITYLRITEEAHSNCSSLESRQKDWKSFYSQYDKRRNKDFVETFPALKEWWESIKL